MMLCVRCGSEIGLLRPKKPYVSSCTCGIVIARYEDHQLIDWGNPMTADQYRANAGWLFCGKKKARMWRCPTCGAPISTRFYSNEDSGSCRSCGWLKSRRVNGELHIAPYRGQHWIHVPEGHLICGDKEAA